MWRFAVICLSLLSAGPLVAAQTDLERAATARTLLGSSHAASGAGQLSAGSRTVSFVGEGTCATFSEGTVQVSPVRVYVLGLGRIRWELDTPSGTVVTVLHGHGGWTDAGGRRRPLPTSELSGRGVEFFPTLALADWAANPIAVVRAQGRLSVDGRNVQRISIERDDDTIGNTQTRNAVRRMFRRELQIDEASLLPHRLSFFVHAGDWRIDIPSEFVFSDYRRIGPVLMPMTITQFVQGRKTMEVNFQRFDFNAVVPESLFRVR